MFFCLSLWAHSKSGTNIHILSRYKADSANKKQQLAYYLFQWGSVYKYTRTKDRPWHVVLPTNLRQKKVYL